MPGSPDLAIFVLTDSFILNDNYYTITFTMVQGHVEHFSFLGVAESKRVFGICQAAQTAVINRYKSVNHKASIKLNIKTRNCS
jgi:hypothetical protein